MGQLKGKGDGGAALGAAAAGESGLLWEAFLANPNIRRAGCEDAVFPGNDVCVLQPRSHGGSRQERHPLAAFIHVTRVYGVPSKQGNCSACWDEQLADQAAKLPFFPWTPILTCCRPFTQIPLPAAVAFFPISSSFCFIDWQQRPRCCWVLDTNIARF